MSSPSVASSFSTAAFIPRSMFVPWSPSPIAVSSAHQLGAVLGDDGGEVADPGTDVGRGDGHRR